MSLLGKILAYSFHEETRESGGADLKLFRVNEDGLECVVDVSEWGSVGYLGAKRAINYLKENNIQEVISPCHLKTWSDIPGYGEDIEVTWEDDVLVEWSKYSCLTSLEGSDLLSELQHENIRVKLYDVEEDTFYDL